MILGEGIKAFETVKSEQTIRGRFASVTADSIRRLSKRVQLPEEEVRDAIRTARWREAREWLDQYVRPWISSIHDRKSAESALERMPPEWITGDEHIDELVGAYATKLVENSAKRYQERTERDRELAKVLPPRTHPRRHEARALKRAAKAKKRGAAR